MSGLHKVLQAIQWVSSGVIAIFLTWNIIDHSWAMAVIQVAMLWFWLPEHIKQLVIRCFCSRRVAELEATEEHLRAQCEEARSQWLAWQLRAQGYERRLQGYSRTATIPASADPQILRELVQAGRKAMAMKYHPDRGGSTEFMQRVNATADAVMGR